MRHKVKGKKLNRNAPHRRAMFRNLVLGLLAKCDGDGASCRIVTTITKAKASRSVVEKLITIAKKANEVLAAAPVPLGRRDSGYQEWRTSPEWRIWASSVAPAVALRRKAFAFLRDDDAVQVLFTSVASKFVGRAGGYTRVVRLPSFRVGDASRLAILELTHEQRRVTKSRSTI
jgi:large subunit ribosomal protein L17